MCNKVLGYPTEIGDFVLGDGSYYSLFSPDDMKNLQICYFNGKDKSRI